jgi:hypothetical protein
MSDKYEVGYGRPPLHGRFKPGQSGNPKGRPKGSRNLATELMEILSETATVTEGGRKRKVPRLRALMLKLVAQAFSGNMAAFRLVIEQVAAITPPEPANNNEDAGDDEAILKAFEERMQKRRRAAKGDGHE